MKECISTEKAAGVAGPYSQAVKSGNLIFISGQLPLVPATGTMIAGRIREQTRQALENLAAIVEAAGGSLSSVIRTTLYVTDLNDFGIVNSIYAEFFPEKPPARSTVQVALLPKGALIEVDAVAEVE